MMNISVFSSALFANRIAEIFNIDFSCDFAEAGLAFGQSKFASFDCTVFCPATGRAKLTLPLLYLGWIGIKFFPALLAININPFNHGRRTT